MDGFLQRGEDKRYRPAPTLFDDLDEGAYMSRPRRFRLRRYLRGPLVAYRVDEMTAERAALAGAKASGCTCQPHVQIDGVRAYLSHDHWCGLLRREDAN